MSVPKWSSLSSLPSASSSLDIAVFSKATTPGAEWPPSSIPPTEQDTRRRSRRSLARFASPPPVFEIEPEAMQHPSETRETLSTVSKHNLVPDRAARLSATGSASMPPVTSRSHSQHGQEQRRTSSTRGRVGLLSSVTGALNVAGYRDILPDGTSSGFSSDIDSDDSDGSDVDSDTSHEPPLLWSFAEYFASLPGHDFCVRIPPAFIQDEFNLFELPDVFHCPRRFADVTGEAEERTRAWRSRAVIVRVSCLCWLGGMSDEHSFDDLLDFITIEDLTGTVSDVDGRAMFHACARISAFSSPTLEDPVDRVSPTMLNDAVLLYQLLHQRYILSKAGVNDMWEKLEQRAFGTCPRFYCHEHPLLPVGLSALPRQEQTRLYCPNCQDLYMPTASRHARLDGCVFGPTFAHFFVRTTLYASLGKAGENRAGPHAWHVYTPKIYGFRIYQPEHPIRTGLLLRKRPVDFK